MSDKHILHIKLDDGACIPVRAHADDAGLDLRTPTACTVSAHGSCVVNTGVHAEIPVGYAGMLKSKSGLNVKHGITSEGVIDAGFTGVILVKLYNHSDTDYHFKEGDKITQLVLVPVLTPEVRIVDEIIAGERGDDGYGSSGA